ncbi:MAG: D-glycero-beta-D-manno-heptose-7-phosphate kinase [Bacilli bacterium]|nr:D-glycero-beta-D-manno-heptose-7-phosphate kinase [Bacilli bacterium]
MNVEKLRAINDKNILVFGDYMVDKYILGDVSRISPEAPVPVIQMREEQCKIGGAGNVINNIISLGANVKALGCVGEDEAGNFIIDNFNKNDIDILHFRKMSNIKTICKTRIVSKKQQFLRIDEENIKELPYEYYDYLNQNIEDIFSEINLLIISDYAKGAVVEKTSQLLIRKAKEKNIPIIVDPKGNDYSKYFGATIVTPNVKELSDVVKKELSTEESIIIESGKLCENFGFDYVMLTRSEKGISSINKDYEKKDFPAVAKEIIDVSGAGDTVVATMALTMTLGFSIEEMCRIANIAASIVVSKFGTSTVNLNELVSNISITREFKLLTSETADYIIEYLRENGKKIVFTNGCFDLLHAGHLSSFKKAKEFGDVLIVAVNSDLSIKRIKGELRPIIKEKDRIEMLCALECIDYVILMEDDNPIELLKKLKPDVSVKGKDWENKNVVEKPVIEEYGGKIEFIDLESGISTTTIIERILRAYNE